ncbi:lipoyltransferase 1, mitochondrial [Copidosoma floridanum]|uniref:lipoyltransferase 1, mitochondrial n=1 Tax=Copidosoma floridanum TaxID=29053 RepID=UPI0006C9A53E|nr:lipoyltransferase 1, mitochondrial [Copidosoma floridanum]
MSVITGTANILAGAKAIRTKFGSLSVVFQRHVSSKSSVKSVPEEEIKKSVFISQSNDIFTNLALEDWIYRNYDLTKHHVLLLWKNNPCVVIGRHQNPWVECNVPAIERNEVALARRNSGGGTVYHDQGNLNLSFFTPRERYNRRYNLDIITRALFRECGLNAVVNEKDDIVVQNQFKVSGTAAKLGRPNAYHHCTLLVNASKRALRLALKKVETGITTKATESVRSPVKNLIEVNPHITSDQLLNAVGWEYLRTKSLTLEDGRYKLVEQQRGFKMINPTEEWFPGIDKLKEEFQSWDWIYGKTPDFTVTRLLEAQTRGGREHFMKLIIEVEKSIVKDIKMTLPSNFDRDASVITNLQGTRYNHELTDRIVEATGCKVVASDVTAQSSVAAI